MNEANAVVSAGVLIREPRESEFPACRVLLPDACAFPAGRVFRLAFDAAKPSILGALSYIDDGEALNAVHLQVVKTRRRSGIGTHLLNYTLDEARRLGRNRVMVDADLKSQPDAQPFLSARGFRLIGSLTSVHGPLLGLNPKYPLFLQRLKGIDDLPPSARMVGISEAPLDQVLQLYAQHIAHMPPLPGMLRSFQPSQYPESVVLLIGDRVIGYVLAQVVGDVVRVPALVVLPEYRGKRIAVRLIAAMDEAVRERVTRAEFDFADSAIFTAKLASEFGHEVVRIAARFERSLS